ncbi:HlyD family secretion protein, partial [Thioclava sp. BHET1]
VDSNTEVKAGQVLARIDPAGPQASYNQAKASLAAAKTAVTSAQAELEEAKAAVGQDQSSLESARVTAQNDQRTLDRLTNLKITSGNTAVSQQSIDDAKAAANTAKADVDKAQAAIVSANAAVDAAKAGVASAEAKQQEAEAALASAQVTMDHLTIKAPFDGQVVQLNVNTGSYVAAGTQLMALVPNKIYVTANFKETQLASIHPGDKVAIAVDAYPGVDFHGHVGSIQRGAGQAFQLLPAQNATGNYVKVVQRVPVRISIDGPNLQKYVLGPGMSVEPTVRIGGQ